MIDGKREIRFFQESMDYRQSESKIDEASVRPASS
jgi:hypothetical protein